MHSARRACQCKTQIMPWHFIISQMSCLLALHCLVICNEYGVHNSWLHLISWYTPEYTYHMHACKALPPLNQFPSWFRLSLSQEHVFLQQATFLYDTHGVCTTTPYYYPVCTPYGVYTGYVQTKSPIPCVYPSTEDFTMRHWQWQHLHWLAWAEFLLNRHNNGRLSRRLG